MGCAEIVKCVFYVSSSVVSIGGMIVMIEPSMKGLEPVIYLVFYIVSLVLCIFSGRLFWRFSTVLGILSLGMLLLYCFSSLKDVNFMKYAYTLSTNDSPVSDPWFVGGAYQFVQVLPLSAWMFIGVEALRKTSGDIPNPKVNIPRGQVACMLTLLATGMFVIFVSASLPPSLAVTSMLPVPFNNGTLSHTYTYTPLTHSLLYSYIYIYHIYVIYIGFQLAYGLSDNVTAKYATILSIPATFGTAFGFLFIYGKIIMCMSNSKLLPEFLSYRHPTTRSPYMALIVGSIVSFCICIGGLYYPAFHKQTFNISMFAASYDYIWQMVGYILLRSKYQTIKCDFKSPFGIHGAVWSMLVFGVTLFSVMVFQIDYLALIIGSTVCGSLSVWYFIYAKWHQSFSEEEQKTFFTIHVINCKYNMCTYMCI